MEKKPLDIRALLKVVARRKWFLIIPILISAAVAGYEIKTAVPVYQATASILLGRNTFISASMSRVVPGAEVQNRQQLWRRRETITKQILNNQLIGKVIDRVGLEPSQKNIDLAKDMVAEHPEVNFDNVLRLLHIQSVQKKVVVTIPRRAEYFVVGFKSRSPEKAYLVAKTLAEVFIEENLLQELSGVKETLKFSNDQLQIYKTKLDRSEARLRVYRRNMAQDASEKLPVTMENLNHVNSLIASISVEMGEKLDQLNKIEREMRGLTSEIRLIKTDAATSIKAKLIEKISRLAELMITFSWNSREVLSLKQDISHLKDQLVEEIRKHSALGLDGRYKRQDIEMAVQRGVLVTEIDLLNQQESTLGRLVDLYRSQQSEVPAHEINLRKMEAEVAKNREIYQTFVDQVQSMKIREAMQRSEAQILYRLLDPAQIPVTPINTDLQKVVLFSLIMGFGVGGGMVYLLEFMDNSFKSVDEVENYLGLMVIGTVPRIEFGEQQRSKKKWALPSV